jgi:transposase-like protein
VKVPATLSEFEERFPTEESCWRHVRRVRWPEGFRCPRCGATRSHRLGRPHLEQCASCRYQVSATAGTVFHGTRVPLRTWFWAIFFVARHKKSISALQLQRDVGLGSYKSAWLLLHKLRSALTQRGDELLQGLVEVDESFVGGRKIPGSTGRGSLGKTIVALAVESRGDRAGRVRLRVIARATQAEVLPFLHDYVDPSASRVATDGLQTYRVLPEAGFRHRRRVQGAPERAVRILPWVHRIAGNLKTWLRGTFHGVSRKHLQRYLDEFAFRLEHRWTEQELFGHVLRRATLASPLSYRRLVAESAG